MKLGITHDWLTIPGGAEKVVKRWYDLYPQSLIYTSVFNKKKIGHIFEKSRVIPSFMQRVPFSQSQYTKMLSLMPQAFESFDLSDYDVVLSSSSSCAKGVITGPDTLHIAYIHTPMRYAWDLYHQYYKSSGKIARMAMKKTMPKIRQWDVINSQRIDYFIANSHFIARRIEKYYRRKADVIFPPVDTLFYTPNHQEPEDFYLILSRFVPYKKIDLAIKACNKLNKRLIIIGGGSQEEELKKIAGTTIEFKGRLDDNKVKSYYQRCKAFLFPGLEDFGITPVEAQACGRPVIAFGQGGALDTVVPHKTGLLFKEQSTESLVDAITRFEKQTWDAVEIRKHAEKFSNERFDKEIKEYIESKYAKLHEKRGY